jgi:hypothetical protein
MTDNILKRYNSISKAAEQLNSANKEKRFVPMQHGRNGRVTEVGIYDYFNKKYVVTDVRAFDALVVLDEMEALLKQPGKKKFC